MVNLDGVIIVDETGYLGTPRISRCEENSPHFVRRRPIIQTNFRNVPPSYPLLHVDAFNSALEKAQSSTTGAAHLDPVLFFNIPVSPERNSSVCCHVGRNGLHFLCPVSVDGELPFPNCIRHPHVDYCIF